MDEKEWSGGARLAGIPSAVLLPDKDGIAEWMLDQVVDFGRESEATMIVVARPDRLIRGRRLDQTVSRHAPYSEDLLRSMAANGITHG
jgi:ATP-dependent DNA helicase RecQ